MNPFIFHILYTNIQFFSFIFYFCMPCNNSKNCYIAYFDYLKCRKYHKMILHTLRLNKY